MYHTHAKDEQLVFMDIAWLIESPWVFKLLGGTHHGYECGFIILQTYEGSGQGCEQTRATVRSVQSALCVKSCVFFFKRHRGK